MANTPAMQSGPAVPTKHPPPDARERKRLSGPALRTFFRLAGPWKLSTSEQMGLLGFPPKSTFYHWRKVPESASLPYDTLQRLSLIFGIYAELQTLMPTPEAADNWARAVNDAPLFGGQAPITLMASGHLDDLLGLRRYLYAVGEGWV
jgi:hypothetical protein